MNSEFEREGKTLSCLTAEYPNTRLETQIYRGAFKSLARPTYFV